MDKQDEANSRI